MLTTSANPRVVKQEWGAVIDSLDLSDLQKHSMHSRWLDQVLWMDRLSENTQIRYYILRLTAVIGSVSVPTLVSLPTLVGPSISDQAAAVIRYITVGISLLVAISAASEEFFHYGERWRLYRRATEDLKTEGWEFIQLGGPYRLCKSHDEGYRTFAEHVEDIIRTNVMTYVTRVARERDDGKAEAPCSPTREDNT